MDREAEQTAELRAVGRASGLPLRTRWQTYGLLAAAVVGTLVVGLAVPFVFGSPLDQAVVQLGDGSVSPADPVEVGAETDVDEPDQDGLPPLDDVDEGPGDEPDAAALRTSGPRASDDSAPSHAQPGASLDADAAPATDEPAAGPVQEQEPGARALSATDRGVTEDRIRLGILLLETANLGKVGIGVPGIDPEREREAWMAWIDEVNEAGGINGRLIEPHFRTYDVFDENDMRAACLELTQDKRVFAVTDAGGFFGAPVLCVTEENETPLLISGSQGMSTEFFRRSQGRLFSVFQGGSRAMRNLAWELHQQGHLRGKTIGILTDQRPGQLSTADQLEAALGQLGYEVAYRAEFDADFSVGSSQIPVEVQQMRSRGVDAIINKANIIYGIQFVQAADNQAYHPQYFVSDWQNGATDTYAQGMPRSYDGAIAITVARYNEHRVGQPEPEDAAACVRTYAERTGRQIERGDNEYGLYVRGCVQTRIFAAATSRAGPELTRARFQSAMGELGEIGLGDLVAGSFAPDKPDAADFVRTLRYSAECRCHLPIDGWRRTRF